MTESDRIINVVLVDDHKLVRRAMAGMINGFSGYEVVWEADNGKDFIDQLSYKKLPEIVLLDVKMPVMDGFQTAQWLEQRFPDVKILALSMFNDDDTIMQMLTAGVDGYILKNADPMELETALGALQKDGSYFSNRVTRALLDNVKRPKREKIVLSERETEFLKLACTELPYKSFGPFLDVSVRVVEAIRADLFRKLNVVSRSGLVLYAIKHGIYKIE